jgi:hypothetical protein
MILGAAKASSPHKRWPFEKEMPGHRWGLKIDLLPGINCN